MIDKEDGGQWPQRSSKTSCSSLRGKKERQIRCPVWLPQLQTQRGPQVLLTPSLLPAALDQPRDLSGCGLLSNCTHHAARKKAKMWGQVMCQLLHPTSLRHRQELPRMSVQGVGLSRGPQSRGQAESRGKRPASQRDLAPFPQQCGLGSPKDWLCPGLQPFVLHSLIPKRPSPRVTPNMSVWGKSLSRKPAWPAGDQGSDLGHTVMAP
ncbi:hypothetical protein Y1Q_0012244 [Alligator mississippiensis]|uniref:Uncharacterized protein n=1 Tax=Alligator mississippiensis TaxID=8496 RepID=A0A151NV06_ALLMI|nr:hypothetical protein Y1Q_0012244 [Alligator mississippiensis]